MRTLFFIFLKVTTAFLTGFPAGLITVPEIVTGSAKTDATSNKNRAILWIIDEALGDGDLKPGRVVKVI
jgi:hypothetical protein